MKTFKKSFQINADTEDVYAALTNPKTIELWSGYPAVMDTTPGSEFSMWEGDITGRIMEAIENKRIVQEWYFGELDVPSVAMIILVRDFGNTLVTVEHTNIPDSDFENISEGWREYIMGAIQRFFNPNF
ncbi:MAG: SRPBCC domain-containing protein [Bacteroidales bacterium]